MNNNAPIGFMDSGVGGLTVVREALKQLPNETLYYLGDSARCPYGPRPAEQVLEYTWEMTRFLMRHQVKMLVIACNTATAVALPEIKRSLPIPVLGVISPGTRAALKSTSNNQVGVIGTEITVTSGAYSTALQQKSPQTTVLEQACPKFVPIVESKQYESPIARKIVRDTLKPLKDTAIDTLVLGCTHYPLLRPLIQEEMGSGVTLIDSGAEAISEVSMLLDYYELSAKPAEQLPDHRFFTTGSKNIFETITKDWLGLDKLNVTKIDL